MSTPDAPSWPSPAKINLFLHITGRRPDGYHLLQTAFQFLDFGDSLSFSLNNRGTLALTTPLTGVSNADNLVLRAAKALQQLATQRGHPALGASITLDKILPMGGGLGGGSSNAATTLVALNQLWQLHLSTDELIKLGLTLGADVPVFIFGHAAWAEGVGEKLTPINPAEPWYLVINPGVAVATAEIFQAKELTRDCPAITIRALDSGDTNNVCEDIVCQRYPSVANALAWLRQQGEAAMSGTGASLFAPCSSRAEAEQRLAAVPAPWHGFVARGVNISPLQTCLMNQTSRL
ncbi:MAG: 4-(cytidine 5'-diphospho)-2-C-methyl-D-erythritol kinase [Gammaproteobacteria bacterium]|nr:4-(cytidine 5'-diphospho)-2-C-methyl-D-erythritol kinase [Gammaproteobacteria bacterium]